MKDTVIRFDTSKFRPYKLRGEEMFVALSMEEIYRLRSERKRLELTSDWQLPDHILVNGFQLLKRELPEIYFNESNGQRYPCSHELILVESHPLEIQANQIEALWFETS